MNLLRVRLALVVCFGLGLGCSSATRAVPPGSAGSDGQRPPTGGTAGSAGAAGGGAAPKAGSGGGGAPGGSGVPADGAPGAPPSDAQAESGAGPAADAQNPGATADGPPPPVRNPFVYVGATALPRLTIFELDLATGALSPVGTATTLEAPNCLAVHPTRRFLYVTSQVRAGRVVAFAIDGTTGALTRLNDVSSGGASPSHISVHGSGRWLLVANYVGNSVAALPLAKDGRLADPVSVLPAGNEAHMAIDDGASGNFVFVPSKGSNRLGQFRFDPRTGALTPNDPAWLAEGGAPRHMAFHRSGRFAYLLTESSSNVVAYTYDGTTGRLAPLGRAVAADSGFGSTIVMHPSLDLFYVGVRGPDTITAYAIDAEGKPTQVGRTSEELSYPWDFSIDATGSYLVAANNRSASIKVFRVHPDTGNLTLVGGAAVPAAVRTVRVVSPP